MQSKRLIAWVLLLVAVTGSLYGCARVRKDWDANAIRARYVGAQLTETDPQHASLLLTYELTSNADSDARLADGPGFTVVSRLKSDRSLSSQEEIVVSYPAFLPAHQSARIALEVRHPLAWPDAKDPEMQNRLKEFVSQRLADVEGFVLFDQPDHFQIEFPSGWQDLNVASGAEPANN